MAKVAFEYQMPSGGSDQPVRQPGRKGMDGGSEPRGPGAWWERGSSEGRVGTRPQVCVKHFPVSPWEIPPRSHPV